mmetsp:Transcript_19545/g.38846  ORF Transcript_19545/g.38846 Transcript_19545/m.38846 type:complete len:121 (-) Transcript_19545:1534-1896(-)
MPVTTSGITFHVSHNRLRESHITAINPPSIICRVPKKYKSVSHCLLRTANMVPVFLRRSKRTRPIPVAGVKKPPPLAGRMSESRLNARALSTNIRAVSRYPASLRKYMTLSTSFPCDPTP